MSKEKETPKKQFYGPDEVVTIGKEEFKTPAGELVYKVYFKDGRTELMTKKMFDQVIQDAPSDYTELRDRRVHPMVEEALKSLSEWGIRRSEVEFFITMLLTSIDENISKANELLYGCQTQERSMMDFHKVFIEHGKKPEQE